MKKQRLAHILNLVTKKEKRINTRSSSYFRTGKTITLCSNRECLFKRIEEIAPRGCSENERAARIISSLRREFKLTEILAALCFPKATYMYWQQRFDRIDPDLQIRIAIEDIRKDHPNYTFLAREIEVQHMKLVQGKGKHKIPLQRLFERAEALYDKRKEYEYQLYIMGERNSYSKTDHDATFMRMKEDHMRNGQLKPAYNVQLAVHSEYIMGVGVFPKPNDTNTLIPFVQQLEQIHSRRFTYVVADTGYDSHENLTWLKNNHYLSCIKPQYYEKAKTRAWANDISKARNMEYIPEEDAFICAKGRKLKYAFTRNAKNKTGFVSERKVYICESCNRCGYKKECQRYIKPTSVNPVKRVEIAPAYDAVLAENQDRLISDTGIQLRINRSIQVEGAFGVLKQDLGFRRFLHRGSGKVHKMLYLLVMGFNITKLHNRIHAGRVNTTLFPAKETA